jgi:hypothetical protein
VPCEGAGANTYAGAGEFGASLAASGSTGGLYTQPHESRSLITFARRRMTSSRNTPGYYTGRNRVANFMFKALSVTPVSGSK